MLESEVKGGSGEMETKEKSFDQLIAEASPEVLEELARLLRVERGGGQKKKEVGIPEHNLIYKSKCEFCESEKEQWMSMVKDERLGCLVAKHLVERPVNATIIHQNVRWCECCRKALLALTKEEIVERAIRVLRKG
jgi:hypothetical protein